MRNGLRRMRGSPSEGWTAAGNLGAGPRGVAPRSHGGLRARCLDARSNDTWIRVHEAFDGEPAVLLAANLDQSLGSVRGTFSSAEAAGRRADASRCSEQHYDGESCDLTPMRTA